MVRVRENIVVQRQDGKGEIELKASRQLSYFFNCYAQSINKSYKRHGKLFEEPFRRKEMDNADYFTALIFYIHFNARQHGFVKDFREWEFSSWGHYLNDHKSFVEKSTVLEWFGNKKQFISAQFREYSFEQYHSSNN